MVQLLLAVFLVLFSSGLCSGSEAALFSIPIIKARQLAQSKKKSASVLLKIRQNMSRPIASIVILNNIANIVGSIIVGNLTSAVLGSQWLGLCSGILTFLVIIFSEIVPKTLGERYAVPIALIVARPVLILSGLLTPLIWCIEKLTAPLAKGGSQLTTNESEIRLLAQIGQQEGVIERDESEMIQRVFQLNDKTAIDLMTPRVAMTYLRGKAVLQDVKPHIFSSQHTRIVITGETIDDILGFALKSEFLMAMIEGQHSAEIATFAHKVQFVPEQERADQLLLTFQKSRQHLAVVVDEYGGVSGVITLEDILEVLTGEIVDETDQVVDLQQLAKRQRRRNILHKSDDS
jgi:CBS domain containing-hemolysin-like protein